MQVGSCRKADDAPKVLRFFRAALRPRASQKATKSRSVVLKICLARSNREYIILTNSYGKMTRNGIRAAPAAGFCLFTPFNTARKRVPSSPKRSEFSSVSPFQKHGRGKIRKIQFFGFAPLQFLMKNHIPKPALFSAYVAKAIGIERRCKTFDF